MSVFKVTPVVVASLLTLASFVGSPPAHADPEPVRVIIFSAPFGAGHDAAARRVEETIRAEYAARGLKVEIIQKNSLDFASEFRAKVGLSGFTLLQTKAQILYTATFNAYLHGAKNIEHAGQMRLYRNLGIHPEDMEAFMRTAFKGPGGNHVLPDAVFSTWPGSTEALIWLKRERGLHYSDGKGHGRQIKFAHVQTDNGTERYFRLLAEGSDLAALPNSESYEAYHALGMKNIVLTGMPVNLGGVDLPSFEDNERAKHEARKALNLDPDAKTVMIEGGKNGATNYVGIIAAVLHSKPGARLNFIANCGMNEEAKVLVETLIRGAKRGTAEFDKLYSAMSELVWPWKFSNILKKGGALIHLRPAMSKAELTTLIENGIPSNVKVYAVGWSKIDPLRAAADLVITKPGGLSTAELAAKGHAMVVMQEYASGEALPNGPLYAKKGMAVVNADITKIGPQISGLLDDEVTLRRMYKTSMKFRSQFQLGRIMPFVDERYEAAHGYPPQGAAHGTGAGASFCSGLFAAAI